MLEDPHEHINLWNQPQYLELKMKMIGRLMNWMVTNDVTYNSSRGGEAFPDKSQWSQNNPL